MLRKLFLSLLFFPLLGFAQRVDNTASFRYMSKNKYFRISYDNDYFTATDRYYTQGINLELVHPHLNKNPLAKTVIRLKKSKIKYGLAIDHFGFTPTSIRRDTIIKNDRPFAAVIMLKTFAISFDTVHKTTLSSALSIGAIGPLAFGKGMQSTIHRWIGDIQPLGWQHQIKNDLAITYEVNFEKQVFDNNFFVFNSDVQLRVGTLSNKVRTGFNFRIGKLNSPFTLNGNKKFQLFFFNQSLINFIGYDATLQGGMFSKNSPYTIGSSDVSRIIFQDNFGGVMTYKKLYLEYFQSVITKEFRTGKLHRWGGVKIGGVF
ncbi:MAG: lipid A deacylase LpxR family protein [Bacteroidia bacterium]